MRVLRAGRGFVDTHAMSYFKHGEAGSKQTTGTPEYRVWSSMISRCTKPNSKWYSYYGGRGIEVCERWMEYTNFLLDMGRRPSSKHSIERTDNDQGYSKENCCWALQVVQIRNRRNTRIIDFNGNSMAIATALEMVGFDATERNIERVNWRINNGWSVNDAVRTPVQSKGFRYVQTA